MTVCHTHRHTIQLLRITLHNEVELSEQANNVAVHVTPTAQTDRSVCSLLCSVHM